MPRNSQKMPKIASVSHFWRLNAGFVPLECALRIAYQLSDAVAHSVLGLIFPLRLAPRDRAKGCRMLLG